MEKNATINIVVAIAQNNVIGEAGSMPWHFPKDLTHFKQLTQGHTVIIGRRLAIRRTQTHDHG